MRCISGRCHSPRAIETRKSKLVVIGLRCASFDSKSNPDRTADLSFGFATSPDRPRKAADLGKRSVLPAGSNMLRHPEFHIAGQRAAGRCDLDISGCRAGSTAVSFNGNAASFKVKSNGCLANTNPLFWHKLSKSFRWLRLHGWVFYRRAEVAASIIFQTDISLSPCGCSMKQ
jgi:hypothetical protein